METYYGITKKEHLKDIAQKVCDVFGHGKNNSAVDLLLETCQKETKSGEYRDPTAYAGIGCMQFDKIGFDDVKARATNKEKELLKEHFDIDLFFVTRETLRYSPLVSFIFARLKYKRIPAEIPPTLEGRAEYWKKHYNSSKGKGTAEQYIVGNTRINESEFFA